jgi:hypothetical protein
MKLFLNVASGCLPLFKGELCKTEKPIDQQEELNFTCTVFGDSKPFGVEQFRTFKFKITLKEVLTKKLRIFDRLYPNPYKF